MKTAVLESSRATSATVVPIATMRISPCFATRSGGMPACDSGVSIQFLIRTAQLMYTARFRSWPWRGGLVYGAVADVGLPFRRRYARLSAAPAFHIPTLAPESKSSGPEFLRVLVVCTGNICRSPTGEGVLRAL